MEINDLKAQAENDGIYYFTKVYNYVIEDTDLNVYEKMIYITLLRFAGAKRRCYPGKKRLAKLADCSVKTVTRSLKSLNEKGYMEIQRRTGRTNIYKLHGNAEKFKKYLEDKRSKPVTESIRVVSESHPPETECRPPCDSKSPKEELLNRESVKKETLDGDAASASEDNNYSNPAEIEPNSRAYDKTVLQQRFINKYNKVADIKYDISKNKLSKEIEALKSLDDNYGKDTVDEIIDEVFKNEVIFNEIIRKKAKGGEGLTGIISVRTFKGFFDEILSLVQQKEPTESYVTKEDEQRVINQLKS